MLNALQGYDPLDLDSADHPTEDFTAGIDAGIRGMVFAVIPSLLAIATPEVKAAFATSLATLESLGARVTNIEPLAGIDDYRGMVQNISAVETNDYNEAIVNQEPPVIAESIRKRIALGRQPEGILIPPDGSRAFVAVNGDNNVAVIDLKTWTVTSRISAGTGPDGLAWVP